jgi:hypothetical protein
VTAARTVPDDTEAPEVPLCTGCLTPVGQGQHYCDRCGAVVGQLTAYLPFEGIRFEADYLAAMWKRAFRKGTRPLVRAGSFLLALALAPILLLVLPLMLFGRRRRAKPSDGTGR